MFEKEGSRQRAESSGSTRSPLSFWGARGSGVIQRLHPSLAHGAFRRLNGLASSTSKYELSRMALNAA